MYNHPAFHQTIHINQSGGQEGRQLGRKINIHEEVTQEIGSILHVWPLAQNTYHNCLNSA